MNIAQIAQEIMEALFAPLTTGGSAIAEVIRTTFVDMLFEVQVVEGVETVMGLNPFGGTVIVFSGVSLLLGLTYLVYRLIRSKIG